MPPRLMVLTMFSPRPSLRRGPQKCALHVAAAGLCAPGSPSLRVAAPGRLQLRTALLVGSVGLRASGGAGKRAEWRGGGQRAGLEAKEKAKHGQGSEGASKARWQPQWHQTQGEPAGSRVMRLRSDLSANPPSSARGCALVNCTRRTPSYIALHREQVPARQLVSVSTCAGARFRVS